MCECILHKLMIEHLVLKGWDDKNHLEIDEEDVSVCHI